MKRYQWCNLTLSNEQLYEKQILKIILDKL